MGIICRFYLSEQQKNLCRNTFFFSARGFTDFFYVPSQSEQNHNKE